jgi:hypothetical protein
VRKVADIFFVPRGARLDKKKSSINIQKAKHVAKKYPKMTIINSTNRKLMKNWE